MDIVLLCLDMGAARAEEIPVAKLTFMPELRKLCEDNACGRYGRNYTCPPFIGGTDVLIKRLKSFQRVIIWQNIFAIEDSFDFDGMMAAQREHNAQTREIAHCVYDTLGRDNCLVLSAGGCMLCEQCGIRTDEPCRNPGFAMSSLEAYGINVAMIGDVSELKYINGKDTVTYFSGVFI